MQTDKITYILLQLGYDIQNAIFQSVTVWTDNCQTVSWDESSCIHLHQFVHISDATPLDI